MRGQLDTAIGMILTLVIVAAVLALAVWGFFQLVNLTDEGSYERVYESLSQAGASHASYGSRALVRIAPPEPFCVFNLSASGACSDAAAGASICTSANLESYWQSAGVDDGNVVFRSGRERHIPTIAPNNTQYACFRSGSQQVLVEGKGRFATIAPLS